MDYNKYDGFYCLYSGVETLGWLEYCIKLGCYYADDKYILDFLYEWPIVNKI